MFEKLGHWYSAFVKLITRIDVVRIMYIYNITYGSGKYKLYDNVGAASPASIVKIKSGITAYIYIGAEVNVYGI